PCEVIPNGVDFSVFFPPTPQAPDSTDLRVLFAGAPTNPIKRHALAAAAVEYAQRALGRPVRLVALHDRPQHEVADAMRGAQLLLLTSTHEGSPNVVKEAIACALPVVTLDVGDVRERLAECPRSIVVASETPETIGNAVLHVLRCGKRDQGRDSLRPLELMTVAARIRDLYIRALAGS
ncbi:MAG: glycosyltransferase, partial [Candidatus Eisenbacteria bacterium]|nr:glycosyltransferase [Candidatus Eisenbacteria bacterium]